MTKQKKLKADAKSLWGIDMGGTKMEGAILQSAENPAVLFRDRVPTEGDKGYQHILNQTKKLFDMMVGQASNQKRSELAHRVFMIRSSAR